MDYFCRVNPARLGITAAIGGLAAAELEPNCPSGYGVSDTDNHREKPETTAPH